MTCPFFRLDSQLRARDISESKPMNRIDVQESLTKVSSSATLGDTILIWVYTSISPRVASRSKTQNLLAVEGYVSLVEVLVFFSFNRNVSYRQGFMSWEPRVANGY